MQLYTGLGRAMGVSEEPYAIAAEISMEYNRRDGSNFCLLRIPRFTLTGKRIMPRVALAGGRIGKGMAVGNYIKQEKALCVINAGLFNASSMVPLGQTVINGSSVSNSNITTVDGAVISSAECYPLCIDGNGDLSAPYARGTSTSTLIAAGVVHAVTGWGQMIGNFSASNSSKFNEIVHNGKYIRQCIGQYDNGDYMVCTVDASCKGKAANDAGMTYDTLADLLTARGVKFAYSLDGGSSAETVIGLRQINPLYEGTSGQAVATVIRFDVEEV